MKKGYDFRLYQVAGKALLTLIFPALLVVFAFITSVHADDSGLFTSQSANMDQGSPWITTAVFEGEGSNSTPYFSIDSDYWRIRWSVQATQPELSIFNFFVKQSKPFTYPVASMLDEELYSDRILYLHNAGDEYYFKVFTANISKWMIEVQEQSSTQDSTIQISYIKYLGTQHKSYTPTDILISNDTTNGEGYNDYGEIGPVCQYKDEPDEYVVITNNSDSWVDISGWTITNITRGYPVFTFPEHLSTCPPYFNNYLDCGYNCIPPAPCMLGPHQSFRVYTDEINPNSGGFSFNYGPGNMWDNDSPETAVLFNSEGKEISRKSYDIFSESKNESPVNIARIYFKGTLSSNSNGVPSEKGEYVVIRNSSGCFQNLSGWKLVNESNNSPPFVFPQGFYLCPFETIRVYTDEEHPEWDGLCSTYNAGKLLFDYYDEVHSDNNEKCTFFPLNAIHQGSHLSFQYSAGDIWNNSSADIAALYNNEGQLVDRKTYIVLPDITELLNGE